MQQKELLSRIDHKRVEDAIARAEKETSGEIRVHIQPKAGADIRKVAERTFERLGMTKTAARNGVLLFIASEENQFAILGDKGIDEKEPKGFWDEIATKLTSRFKSGEFTDGIVEAIESAGRDLAVFFPRQKGDVNELTNEISTGERPSRPQSPGVSPGDD